MYAENMMFIETLVQNDLETGNYPSTSEITSHAFINTTDSTNETPLHTHGFLINRVSQLS